MRSVGMWLVFFLLCLARPALAQIPWHWVCADYPIVPCQGAECKCSTAMRGDPVNMISGKTLHVKKDVSIDTGFGRFELWRYYTSSLQTAWQPQGYGAYWVVGAPAPFGGSGPRRDPSWSHDLFSFVRTDLSGLFLVYDGTFHWLEFTNQFAEPVVAAVRGRGFLKREPTSDGRLERLERILVRPAPAPPWESYRLIKKDGEQWIYSTPNGSGLTFLSEVRNATGQLLYSVQYQNPVVAGVADCGGSTSGTPFISEVDFAAGGKLLFTYGRNGDGTQCALASLSFTASASSAPTVVAAYTYDPTAAPGQITSGGPTNGGLLNEVEMYSYSANSLSVKIKDGAELYVQTYDPATELVTNYSGAGSSESFAVSPPTGSSYPDPISIGDTPDIFCAPAIGPPNYVKTQASVSASGGTPTAPATTLTATYYSYPDEDLAGKHSAALRARVDDCAGAPACSEGSYVEHHVGLNPLALCGSANPAIPANPAVSLVWKDKRGNWSGAIRRRSPEQRLIAADGTSVLEQPDDSWPWLEAKGSATAQVTDAFAGPPQFQWPASGPGGPLEYTFTNLQGPNYDANGVRMPSVRQRPSVVMPGNTNYEVQWADGTGFIEGSEEGGYTKKFDDNTKKFDVAPTWRKRFTFFSRTRVCTDPATDDIGRVLRMEGPCWDGSCSAAPPSDPTFPVTEFYYADSTASGNDAGRLSKIVRYPLNSVSGCGTVQLTTLYSNFTAEGLPQTVVDEAGATALYTYAGRFMTSRSVGGATTTYAYDNPGLLRSIHFPQGNFEIRCRHASNAAGGCDFTTPVGPRVLWKAKSANADGSVASEKVTYAYWPDGRLKTETFSDSSGTIRAQRSIYEDAHGRPTWEGVGTGTSGPGALNTVRNFDGADNLVAVGSSFTGAPDFCGSAASPSPLCAWMKYDRANRLDQVDTNPTGAVDATASIRTCLDYDLQGNVRRIVLGASSGSACTENKSDGALTEAAGAPPVDYDYDDFKNIIRVRVPWSAQGKAAETYYDYDARGNVIKKQTEQMRASGTWLQFTYDSVDRLTGVSRAGTGTSIGLYALGYDVSLPDPGCPAMTYYIGRLSYRSDSFGYTWYSYDAEGRVLQEIRRRPGGNCTDGIGNNPHTTYTYSLNGNVTSIVYPHGRTVTYGYGAGGLTDRVTSIGVELYLAGSWTARPLIDSVLWEPYGRLRGYEFRTGSIGQDANTVEYYRNGNSESVNVSSACAGQSLEPGLPDGTGRPRALWVSSNANSPGGGSGNILKQFYTWKGKQLATMETCFTALSQVDEHLQTFRYDSTARLTLVSGLGMPVRTTGTRANVHRRTYSYDRRGNRTGVSIDGGCTPAYTRGAGQQTDFLTAISSSPKDPRCQGGSAGRSYMYDLDGRVTLEASGVLLGASLTLGRSIKFGYDSSAPQHGGLDTVFQTVGVSTMSGPHQVTHASYEYYYDTFNRRRMKVFPFNSTEEYFYDLGHQMLSNVGGDVVGSPTSLTSDDYVWLDGRAVAMIRGKLSTGWARASDDTASCDRFGEAGTCGIFHIVNDYLPKPVMMLESRTLKVTNAMLYDEFGHVNRVPFQAGYKYPIVGPVTVGTVSLPAVSAAQVVQARAFYSFIDVPTTVTLSLNGSGGMTGQQTGNVWSSWIGMTGSTATVTATGSRDKTKLGAHTEFIEYRRYSPGAIPTSIPFRFPGQFFDPETDMFENWNRYYDANTGRYLQPESMLQSPNFAAGIARHGLSTPAYSYALNDPINRIDASGLSSRSAGRLLYYFLRLATLKPISKPEVPLPEKETSQLEETRRRKKQGCDFPDAGLGEPTPEPVLEPTPDPDTEPVLSPEDRQRLEGNLDMSNLLIALANALARGGSVATAALQALLYASPAY